MIFKDLFESKGYHVLEAENGEKGWKLAQSVKPDLILLDLMLPKLHGFEVLKNIRNHHETQKILVIVLSALDEPAHKEKGLALGANGYLVKSQLSIKEIFRKIELLWSV